MLFQTAATMVANRLPRLRRGPRDAARYVGIDVGIETVRVATLGRHPARRRGELGSFRWMSQSEFALPIQPSQSPPVDWVDRVVDRLNSRLPRCVDGDRVVAVVSLPMTWIHYQSATKSEMAAAKAQCDAMFTASLFQSAAHLTHWPMVVGHDQQVIAATAESAACRIAAAIARVGYQVQSILPHGPAVLHAAAGLTSLNPSAAVILESSGGLVAIQNGSGCGLCRHLPAQEIPMVGPCELDDLAPWLQRVAAEVSATLRYVDRLGANLDPDLPVLIAGRAVQVPGADAFLASLLERPVATWRYVGRSRPRQAVSSAGMPLADADSAVALSLAFNAIQMAGTVGDRSP